MSQTPTISSSEELCSLVSYALDTALSLGATAAAVEVSEEKGTCVTVRNQETESIEHTHDRDFGITVYLGKSKAVASSGDFRKVSILRTVKAALDMARYTTPMNATACRIRTDFARILVSSISSIHGTSRLKNKFKRLLKQKKQHWMSINAW